MRLMALTTADAAATTLSRPAQRSFTEHQQREQPFVIEAEVPAFVNTNAAGRDDGIEKSAQCLAQAVLDAYAKSSDLTQTPPVILAAAVSLSEQIRPEQIRRSFRPACGT